MTKFSTGSITIDKQFEIIKGNEEFYKYVGENGYRNLAKSAHPDDIYKVKAAVEDLEKEGHSMCVYRAKRYDGRYRWMLADFEYNIAAFEDGNLIDVNVQDIQALSRDFEEIEEKNNDYEEYFSLVEDYMFVYNIDSDYFRLFMGGNRLAIVRKEGHLSDWADDIKKNGLVDEDYMAEFEALYDDIRLGTRSFRHELTYSTTPEKMGYCLFKGKTIMSNSRERRVIGCISEINKESGKREISYNLEANRDAALDILNKKAITEYASRLINDKVKYPVHLCIIDLDNFKTINDTFGHMFGDEVLVEVARILKEAVADKGVVGRIGGDELMVLIERVDNHSELRGILRSIRSNVEWLYKGKKDEVNLTCTIGVASYPDHARNYDGLFKIADKMLYSAKKKGKNRYIIYTPEIHGDVLIENPDVVENIVYKTDMSGEKLVIDMMDKFLCNKNITFYVAFAQIGMTMKLDEIDMFYGNEQYFKTCWDRFDENRNINADIDIDYVDADNFDTLFDENGLAVIDHIMNIELSHPTAYEYMNNNNIISALVYRMNNKIHRGYITFYKKTDAARKWSDSEKAYITFLAKMVELALNDR